MAVLIGSTYKAYGNGSGEAIPSNAHNIYIDLLESSITFKASEAKPVGADSAITFGAEKEASSSLITRIMGPSGEAFLEYGQAQPVEFLRDFMEGFVDV